MTRQHHLQYDSIATSCHGQVASVVPSPAWLDNTAVSMTWQRHRATANVASVVPSPSWLSSDITPTSLPAWLDSAVASMTWQWYHTTTNVASVAYRQLDSAATSRNTLIIKLNDICFQRQADTLPTHTGTIHRYTWFQGQCKRPVALLDTSVIHLHFEDSHFEDFKLWTPKLIWSRWLHLLAAPIRWILLKDSASTQSAFQLRFSKEDPVSSAST
jgi:hypothetical protein